MFADNRTKDKREELNLQKGNLYLVKGLSKVLSRGNCVIHIRKVMDDMFVYRIISTPKGMEVKIEDNYTEAYLDSEVEIVTDLHCNSTTMNLDTYTDIKTCVTDLFPEYFI